MYTSNKTYTLLFFSINVEVFFNRYNFIPLSELKNIIIFLKEGSSESVNACCQPESVVKNIAFRIKICYLLLVSNFAFSSIQVYIHEMTCCMLNNSYTVVTISSSYFINKFQENNSLFYFL